VRGIGLIRSVRDIEDITIAAQKGVPFRVRDVAAVRVGAAPRLALWARWRADIVEGIGSCATVATRFPRSRAFTIGSTTFAGTGFCAGHGHRDAVRPG